MAHHLPPGQFGNPLLGETIPFFANPYQFAVERHARYGAIFKSRVLKYRMVALLTPEAQKYVMVTNADNFPVKGGYNEISAQVHGEDALFLVDGKPHDDTRKLMTPAFHGHHMAGYLEQMNTVIDRQLDKWGQQGTLSFHDEMREMAFLVAGTLLVGLDSKVDLHQLRRWFADLTGTTGMSNFIHIDIPLTSWGRAMSARRHIDPFLRTLIAERRQHPTTDALGLLVSARDEEGHGLTDAQLVSQAKTLLFAGHDTTTSTLTWLMLLLLQHPDQLERLRAEVAGKVGDAVTYEDLRRQPLLDALIKETLRLYPQASVFPRGVKADVQFEGFDLPAGWMVVVAPIFVHRQPQYFAEPARFDPDRFLPPREEDLRTPYAWMGFGSGPHNCIGSGIAQLEIKALLVKLLRRYDISLRPDQDLSPIYFPLTHPKGKILIDYVARAVR